jgi:formate/nitrite transporter FocA (FNT family)
LTTPPSASQILCIYIVTFLIGIGGLHHSIAGSSEIFMAKFLDNSIPISGILKFLTGAITGNLVGGSFFVAVLNYAQIRQSQKLN